MAALSLQGRRRRTGAYLMLAFYVTWIVVTLSIQFYQAFAVYGYGSGFGDGGHVPPQIAASAGLEHVEHPTAAQVVHALTVKGPDGGFVEQTARLLFSLAVLGGIVYFWYSVMSRVGTF